MSGEESRAKWGVLALCRQVELAMQQLYLELDRAHAADAAMAQLWHRTADEEHAHAALFAVAELGKSGIIESVNADPDRIAELLAFVERLTERVRREPPGIEAALTGAIALEKQLADLHADRTLVFKDRHYHDLFASLAAADREHITRLEASLAERRGQTAE
jgi:hypothetical protein